MKNLANCTPREFMVQTNLIRRSVEKWLKATDIMSIRKRTPKLPEIPEGASEEEKAEVLKKRDELLSEAVMNNLFAMIDAAFDQHPDETLELLALLCFVPVNEVDNHPVTYYMRTIRELVQDEEVISFFTSLARLAQMSGT